MRRLVPALAAAVLLFTGCSDDEPDVAPTASADPAETPPPMPELARDDSPAGAEAFVRHYIDVLNYAALTGDTAALEDLSSAECEGCHSYIETITDIYGQDGYIRDESWKVEQVESESTSEGVDVFARVSVSGSTFRESSAAEEQRSDAYRDSLRLSVSRVDESWSVESFVRSDS